MVIEKLREQNIFTNINTFNDGTYEVNMYELYDQDYQWLVRGVTNRSASLAICLAALEAVGMH